MGHPLIESNQTAADQRWYVHGASCVDERLMMHDPDPDGEGDNPPSYYHAIDRMYNVRGVVDRRKGQMTSARLRWILVAADA